MVTDAQKTLVQQSFVSGSVDPGSPILHPKSLIRNP
jgi:hypothetical protein